MKHLLVMALAAGVAATLAVGEAQAAKKIHRFHHAQAAYGPRGPLPFYSDPSGGNAAAAGNNANSMSGSNSAGENANGRTSGGRS